MLLCIDGSQSSCCYKIEVYCLSVAASELLLDVEAEVLCFNFSHTGDGKRVSKLYRLYIEFRPIRTRESAATAVNFILTSIPAHIRIGTPIFQERQRPPSYSLPCYHALYVPTLHSYPTLIPKPPFSVSGHHLQHVPMVDPLACVSTRDSPIHVLIFSTHYVEGDPILEFLKDGVLVMASSGLVFNWFSELERVYFDHVMEEAGHDRVWAVDPLQPTEDDSPAKRSGSRPELASDISPWLDTCEDRTVVYMCFGSQAVLNNNLIEEITSGLEKNRAKFLWVCEGAQTVPILDELARVVAESVSKQETGNEREGKLRRAALDAIKGGSSYKDLDKLAMHISQGA
ncbi:hypothetical protein ACSBR1_042260 [Camellia fascicularis]